jgi:hypothetical protein
MYTIRIKEVRTGEISFDTLEEAKQWHEDREGDVYWYHDDENIKLEREVNDGERFTYDLKSESGTYDVLTTEDITKEVDWL